jgi:DNA-binding beta-propeller fold protein YncE
MNPAGVAVGPDGDIYVTEAGRHRVLVLGPDLQTKRTIGQRGSGATDLLDPRSVAVAVDGRVFVADSGNHRVQVFDADGRHRLGWGGRGRDVGQFHTPCAVTIARDRVYVVDEGNRRVQVFDPGGKPLGIIGGPDTLTAPVDAAVDDAGNVYVLDADRSAVRVFDAGGESVGTWGEWGSQTGMFADPGGIGFRDGLLYVADSTNQRIQVHRPDGTVVYDWGRHAVHPHEGAGKIHYPADVAIAPDGSFAVVTETFEDRLQVFGRRTADTDDQTIRSPWWERSTIAHFGRRAVADAKLLAVTEPDSHSVLIYDLRDLEPVRVHTLGGLGSGFGQLLRPAGLDLDTARRQLVISDSAARRIQTFRLEYEPDAALKMLPNMSAFVRAVDLDRVLVERSGQSDRWPAQPTAVRKDADGNLHVIDARNAEILVFSPDLAFLRAWGAYGDRNGGLRAPADLTFSTDGESVYVTDAYNQQVQVYDRTGQFRFAFRGDGDVTLEEPFGITAAADGSIFVSDAARNRVVKFDQHGKVVKAWGKQGLGAGEFYKPSAVCIDGAGRLIVIDHANHRGQIFSPEGDFIEAFGSRFFTKPARGPVRRTPPATTTQPAGGSA